MEGESMDVNERIRTELNSAPLVLFMKGTLISAVWFSAQTAGALRKLGVGSTASTF
jgi:glutaredoxin-related protein